MKYAIFHELDQVHESFVWARIQINEPDRVQFETNEPQVVG